MCRLEVRLGFADPSIAPHALPSLKFFKWAVEPNEKHIVALQQADQTPHPLFGFDDVLDDKVVAGRGQDRQGRVESCKEARSHVLPAEVTPVDSLAGEYVCRE